MTTTGFDTDFNPYDPAYAADPVPVWHDLQAHCPVARSERFRGMWVPTRYEDIVAVARDPETFSSRSPLVAEYANMSDYGLSVPPISSDPPYHTEIRRLLLPFFSPGPIEALRPGVERHCDELLDGFAAGPGCDGARDYAQHIPVAVIARMLGIPQSDGDRFRGWVHTLLELAAQDFNTAAHALGDFFWYFREELARRRESPGDDLVSFLAGATFEDRPLTETEILGVSLLLLVAGIDTTWSAIGASLWHLASHPADQERLRSEPDLWPTAVEELLRAYSPVTMARELTRDTDFGGCPMRAGDPLLLLFPAANRDPDAFPDPDEVILDRAENRHLAFGVGIHRCLGSNLARLELEVALRRFLDRVPPFTLADPAAVTWFSGQVRGPRTLPLVFDR